MSLLLVVGARPNLVKAWALLRAFARVPAIACRLVHTGQHRDHEMSGAFFAELGIPAPDVALGVRPDTPARQIARIMLAFDRTLTAERPDLVVVVGDVSSTLACALAAAKRGVPVAHVEAGLRSGDWTMPEEVNRVLTDRLSRYLLAPSGDAVANLRREALPRERIHLVGNVMVDTLRAHRAAAARSTILSRLGLVRRRYAVVTLHRPANVDERRRLDGLLRIVAAVARRLPVVFPLHPRTRHRLRAFGAEAAVRDLPGVVTTPPLGYLDFLSLMTGARLVLTDSGGVQEETTALGVPCLTLRDTTERPVTVTRGTNRVVGTQPERVLAAVERILAGRTRRGGLPPYWDGRAAERIARILARVPRARGR